MMKPVIFLLMNLPGSRYTQYNPNRTILNNKFYVGCIDMLLFHLHEKNQLNFMDEYFSFIGFGNGANIALLYSISIKAFTNLHSILVFNAYTYIDRTLRHSFDTLIQNFQLLDSKEKEFSDFFYYNLIYSSDKLALYQKCIMNRQHQKEYSICDKLY